MTIEEIVLQGVSNGLEIMGDDWIGYKFIGEGSAASNQRLEEAFLEAPEEGFNAAWFAEIGVPVLDYDAHRWSEGVVFDA